MCSLLSSCAAVVEVRWVSSAFSAIAADECDSVGSGEGGLVVMSSTSSNFSRDELIPSRREATLKRVAAVGGSRNTTDQLIYRKKERKQASKQARKKSTYYRQQMKQTVHCLRFRGNS
eukprot:m.16845 g.16845  ORF g.16845 m.16845 type:complete len:118 (-) comp8165_c1_seq1:503-856(-)